jgi:hypothetical protein
LGLNFDIKGFETMRWWWAGNWTDWEGDRGNWFSTRSSREERTNGRRYSKALLNQIFPEEFEVDVICMALDAGPQPPAVRRRGTRVLRTLELEGSPVSELLQQGPR